MPDTIMQKISTRKRDSAATRQAILDAAFVEFADHGLSGARVGAITARSGSNVRMIYYYFGSKAGLYCAVLETAYAAVREAERALRLDRLDPAEAIVALAGFMFDYHEANPRFSRLVSIENIHLANHVSRLGNIREVNRAILDALGDILARGRRHAGFRADASPLDVHLLMTSYCFYRVANRHTLRAIFGQDMLAAGTRAVQRRMVAQAVLGFLRTEPGVAEAGASSDTLMPDGQVP